MVSRSARLRVGLVASFVLGSAGAAAQQPARGRVGYATTVSYAAGTAADGAGNTPQTRTTHLQFGLFARAAGDDPVQVATATSRIEVCTVAVGQVVTCPGTSGFVLYDDSSSPAVSLLPGISTKAELAAAIRTSDGTGVSFSIPIPGEDWGVSAGSNVAYFLRVNGEPVAFAPAPGGKQQLPPALRDGGWAGQPRRLTTPEPRFFGVSVPIPGEAGDPFAGALACSPPAPGLPTFCSTVDFCRDGDRAQAYPDLTPCASQGKVGFLGQWQTLLTDWADQDTRPVNTASVSPPTWTNGVDNGLCGGTIGFCPSRLTLEKDNANHGRPDGYLLVPWQGHNWDQPGPFDWLRVAHLDVAVHEYMHKFQDAYRRESALSTPGGDPGVGPLYLGGIAESIPPSAQQFACFDNYPGVPTTVRECVSPGMLRDPNGAAAVAGFSASDVWAPYPTQDAVLNPVGYSADLVWRYFYEQFALSPLDFGVAHPAAARRARHELSSTKATLALGFPTRRPDEGMDLLGPIVRAMAQNPYAAPFETTVDAVLKEYIGRGFENVLFDFHTAYLLQEYPTTDPRWRFTWVGNINAGGADVSSKNPLTKQFASAPPPPTKPYVATPFGWARPEDNLRRPARVLDTFTKSPAGVTPVEFGPTSGVASLGPQFLQPRGAAYLSVRPNAAFKATGKPVRFELSSKVGPKPHVRAFRVEPGGVQLACAVKPSSAPGIQDQCGAFDTVDVAVGPLTSEVLLVVSNTSPVASAFTWKVGQLTANVHLDDPITGHRAPIGTPTDRQPFVLQFTARNTEGKGIELAGKQDVVVRVPNCAESVAVPSVPNPCQTAPSKLLSLGGGAYWAVVTLPQSFYYALPAGGAGPNPTLDLGVRINVAGGTTLDSQLEPGALVEGKQDVVLQVVMDVSGSMNDGSKLVAAKTAAKLALATLGDDDAFGLVTFNNDAQSPLTSLAQAKSGIVPLAAPPGGVSPRASIESIIDNVTAVGWTSVGDGGLEAMSNLVGYGMDSAAGETRRAAMVMITDGQSNAGWIPERFALWEPGSPPYQDGPELPAGSSDPDPSDNQPWNLGISQRLSLTQRKWWPGGPLVVPSVSCLAIGQVVDAAPLQIIADASGGSLQYSDTTSNTTVLSLKRQVAQGVATAVGRQRVSSVVVPSALPSALPAVTSELGARELVVSVSSATPGLESLKLVSPGGSAFAATQVTGDAVVFRIPHPAPGAWSWSQGAAMGAPADALVETQLSTNVQLFAFADVVDRNPLPGPGDNSGTFESGRYTFKPVRIIATVEGATITSATATLRAPPGVTTPLTLVDDGEHGDGLPGDGVFGVVVANGQTAWVGVHGVTMEIAGTLPDGTAFTRVRDLAFELHAGGDLDGDGLPDWWEKDKGTKMATPDAADDPDGDGLENRRELEAGTSPLSADSDGGGESDGSEVFAGRDPLDSSDDGTKPSLVQVFPGVGKVVVVVPMPAQEVSLVQIARSPTQNGAYDRLSLQRRRGAPPGRLAFEGAASAEEPGAPSCVEREAQPFVFDCTAEEAREACYQVSVGTARGHSGWSSAACVTPRLDPFPPRIEGLSVVAGGGRTRGVTLRVQASDDPLSHDRSAQSFLDPAIVASGVAEVMVATREDFSDGTWASPSEELRVWLPPTPRSAAVFVKARDAHGNESGPRTFWIPFVQHTPIDEAIGIEERALDELRAGDATRARASLAASIVRITTSLSRIHARIKAPGAADPTDVELFAGLGAVVAKKEAARVLLAVKRPKEAEALLRAAIAIELALAQLAERTGREL